MGIKPGRNEEKVGFDLRRHIADRGFKNTILFGGRRKSFQWRVERGPQAPSLPRLTSRASTGIPRVLMHGEKVNARVRIEDSLRTIPVMNIPVDDRDTLDLFVFVLSVTGRHGDVVEQAESHRVLGRRVMSRRTSRDKRVVRLTLHHRVDRGYRSACGE